MVDGHTLEVVGTLTKFKSFLGDDSNDKAIMAPYSSFKKFYPQAKDNFICVLAYPGQMDQAKDEVASLLRRRRHVKPSDPDNFGISSADSVITEFRGVISTVALVMVVVSSIGLLVGGIGVMNIMLVSETERTREIGVRKAVGARRSDITWAIPAGGDDGHRCRRVDRYRGRVADQSGGAGSCAGAPVDGAAVGSGGRIYRGDFGGVVLRVVACAEGVETRSDLGATV